MQVNEPPGEVVDASVGSTPNTPDEGWAALFAGSNLARLVVLTGAVAIHALSLRVVVTVLPVAVVEIGGLRFFAWTMTVAMISAIWALHPLRHWPSRTVSAVPITSLWRCS